MPELSHVRTSAPGIGALLLAAAGPLVAMGDGVGGTLYIDPWTLRKEIVAEPQFLEAGRAWAAAPERTTLEEVRAALAPELHALLEEKFPVRVDGREVDFEPGRVRFLKLQEAAEPVELEPGEAVDPSQLRIAADASTPLPAIDSRVAGEWSWFPEGIERVEIGAAWPRGWDVIEVVAESPDFEVDYELAADARAAPEPPPPPGVREIPLPWASAVLALAAGVFLGRGRRSTRLGSRLAAAACTVAAVIAWFTVRPVLRLAPERIGELASAEAEDICERLLEGVYHGFHFHEPEVQYEVLAEVLAGPALESTFLEARRTRERRDRDDTRVTVSEVAVIHAEPEPLGDAPGFSARCRWRTVGLVGHWGHFHQRRNRYQAELRVEVVDGAWKATGFELGTRERE